MNYWIERRREALADVMTRVDIVTVNEAEARQFCGTHNVVKAAREILALGPRAVVIKRAEYGALLLTAGRMFWTPAYPLDEVRDPTCRRRVCGRMLGYLPGRQPRRPHALPRGAPRHRLRVVRRRSVQRRRDRAGDVEAVERRVGELEALVTA